MRSEASRCHVGLLGYGEVGRILAEDLRARDVVVSAYDVKFGRSEGQALDMHAQHYRVQLAGSHSELAADADFIISAVTASQTVDAAKACAPALRPSTWFMDLNSASPSAKRAAAQLIDHAGGRYVEGAVMTSVPSHRLHVPLLLGGPHARGLLPLINAAGLNAQVASDQLGVASATKMCRSIMIKGLEAMVIESFTTARAYGVEAQMLASLKETLPGIDWEMQAAYFFQRVIQHGRRRAEEVREVAQTEREVGLEPWCASGTAERLNWIANLADAGVFGDRASGNFAKSADWRIEADRILAVLQSKRQ